jgi:hypothetical protein
MCSSIISPLPPHPPILHRAARTDHRASRGRDRHARIRVWRRSIVVGGRAGRGREDAVRFAQEGRGAGRGENAGTLALKFGRVFFGVCLLVCEDGRGVLAPKLNPINSYACLVPRVSVSNGATSN